MNEPTTKRAGDTWKWKESAPSDYPATSWTLKYELQGPHPSLITLTATADGDDYDITIALGTTKTYTPGIYRWVSYHEKTSDQSERYQKDEGTINVLPNLAVGKGGADARSHVRRTLDLIEVAIENWGANPYQILTIEGRTKQWSIEEVHLMRSRYMRYLGQEEAAERVNKGLDAGNAIKVRFGATS